MANIAEEIEDFFPIVLLLVVVVGIFLAFKSITKFLHSDKTEGKNPIPGQNNFGEGVVAGGIKTLQDKMTEEMKQAGRQMLAGDLVLQYLTWSWDKILGTNLNSKLNGDNPSDVEPAPQINENGPLPLSIQNDLKPIDMTSPVSGGAWN